MSTFLVARYDHSARPGPLRQARTDLQPSTPTRIREAPVLLASGVCSTRRGGYLLRTEIVWRRQACHPLASPVGHDADSEKGGCHSRRTGVCKHPAKCRIVF